MDGAPVELRYAGEDPVSRSAPVERLRAWEKTTPRVRTSHGDIEATFVRARLISELCRSLTPNTATVR